MHYTVVSINSRFNKNIESSKTLLNESEMSYCDINFFDAKKQNYLAELQNRKIKLWTESKYFEYNKFFDVVEDGYWEISSGAIGHWLSFLNIFEYVVENKIPEILVLEDDAKLNDNFLDIFFKAYKELPPRYDFLSLFFKKSLLLNFDAGIPNKNYIENTVNQKYATLGTVFSYPMCRKMLKYVREEGIGVPADDTIFYLANHKNFLNGFKIKSSIPDIIINLDKDGSLTTIG